MNQSNRLTDSFFKMIVGKLELEPARSTHYLKVTTPPRLTDNLTMLQT